MKYCPNCGNPLKEGDVFCSSCGMRLAAEQAEPAQAAEQAAEQAAPVQAAEQPVPEQAAPKRRRKTGLIIALAALCALLAAAAVLYFTGAFRKILPPSRAKLGLAEKKVVDTGLDKLFDSQKTVKDVDIDLNIKAEIDAESSGLFSEIGMIKSIIDKVSLDLKFDGGNMGLGLNYSGNSVLEGRLISTEEGFGIYVPQLDSKYYTISKQAFAELISSEADEEAAISADMFDMTGLDEAKTRKEVYDLLNIIAKISTEENTLIEKGVSFPLFDGEKTVTADRYTITPDKERLSEVIKELGEYLSREDCYLGGKLKSLFSSEPGDDGETASDPFADLIENCDKYADDIVSKNTKFIVGMVGDEIVSQSMINDDGKFVYDCEKGEKDSCRSFVTYDDGGERILTADAVFDTLNDKTAKGVVKIDAEDQSIKLDVDFSNPDSNLLTAQGQVKLTVGEKQLAVVKLSPEGGKNNITVDVDLSDLESEISSIKLIMVAQEGSGVEAPKDVEPTDVSDWSIDQITEIFEKMGEQLGNVVSDILF